MLTKGAIGNLINRYRAVLKKCNLINTFGSLAVASMLVMGGAGMAEAAAYKGVDSTIDASLITDGKAIGGWEKPSGSDLAEALAAKNFSMNISGGTLEDIIGGQYFSNKHGATVIGSEDNPYAVNSVSTSVNGTTVTVDLVGGHKTNNAYETYLKTDSVKLDIKKITFATPTGAVGNVPEGYIIGGDLLKSGNSEGGNISNGADSTIGKTELTISGSTIGKPIIGGSTALHFYGPSSGYTDLKANVDEAVTTITNSAVSGPVVAGGFAYGTKAESTVGKADLTISSSTMTGDIYAGGLEGGTNVIGASVGSATIVVENSTVGNIYGSDAKIAGDPHPSDSNKVLGWMYTPLAGSSVKTDLILTDASAETVVLNHADSTLTATGGTNVIGQLTGTADINVQGGSLTVNSGITAPDAITVASGAAFTVDATGKDTTAISGKINISGDGDITLKADSTLMGNDGGHSIEGHNITLTSNNGQVLHSDDPSSTIKGTGNIVMTSGADDVIYTANGSETGSNPAAIITVATTGGDVTMSTGDGYAIGNNGGDVTITGKNVDLTSGNRGAVANYAHPDAKTSTTISATGDVTITAKGTVAADKTDARYLSTVYTQTGDISISGANVDINNELTNGKYAVHANGGNIDIIATGKGSITGNIKADKGMMTISFGEGSKIDGRAQVTSGATLKVTGGEFSNSKAVASGENYYGAAIENKGTLSLTDVNFEKNGIEFYRKDIEKDKAYLTYGGAIYNNADGNATITACEFKENYVSSDYKPRAGAIRNEGQMTITNTLFKGNYAKHTAADAMGGALYSQGTLTVSGSTFEKNISSGEGGAASFNGGNVAFNDLEDGVVSENKFIGNTAGKNAGALDIQGSSVVKFNEKNTFENNTASENGGAMAVLGYKNPVVSFDKSSVTIFTGNSAKNGGAIHNDSGVWSGTEYAATINFAGSNTFTGNTASENGGAIYNDEKATINFYGTSTFSDNTANGVANDIYNLGTINFAEGSTTYLAGGISGNGSGTLEGDGSIVVTDAATTITGQKSIASTLTATATGEVNDALSGNAAKLEEQLGGLRVAKMEEGLIAGEVVDGVQKVNTVLADTLEQATAAPLAVNRILMNDVRKRMGDLRSDKNESGVWMRWDGGKLAGDNGLSNNFNTIQIGGDTKVAKNCRFGVAGSFTHGDVDHNNGGGEQEAFTFAAYGTWMAENGMFADVIARVGFNNSELQVKGGRADIDNEALSLSAEYGWRLPVCDQFFLEPQVELTYTHVTGADFTIKTAKYDIDSMDSVIGRAGLVAGWNLPNEMGNVYARASVVHEFLGDAKITATNNGGFASHKLDGDDTWLEYGIGANVKLTDKTYIWADVERTEGASIDEEWRGTVGIRYSF